MKDFTEGVLQQELEKASQEKESSLAKIIKRFKEMEAEYPLMEHHIFTDFAPRSFEFTRMYDGQFSGNGGIIYHGSHDGGGNGSAPTFSVSLTPAKGWKVHT
jgi:hypothetical protein